MEVNELADIVRQTAYEVHLYFSPGYLEKVYENALKHRLEKKGLSVEAQKDILVKDEDGFVVGAYQADLLIDERLVVELKAVDTLHPKHVAQLLNYLRATKIRDGLLINFGSPKFQIRKLRM